MRNHLENIAGATILITGASSGFGRGAALRLAAEGANVVIAARRTELIEDLAKEIAAAGGQALPVTADVSDPADVARLAAAAIGQYQHIDVWINNVGVGALGLFWDIPIEDHARLVDVNLKGVIYGAHEALRRFRAQGFGTLINIGSIDSEVPVAYQASYSATKAAVLSLSRALNEELRLAGDDLVKVGVIMPWAVDTPWWTHAANYTGHAPRMAAMDDPQIVIDAIVRACLEPKEEQPVGAKAHASYTSHQIFPDMTERLTATIQDREVAKAFPAPHTAGAIFEPMAAGATISGGISDRMKEEDAARSESGAR